MTSALDSTQNWLNGVSRNPASAVTGGTSAQQPSAASAQQQSSDLATARQRAQSTADTYKRTVAEAAVTGAALGALAAKLSGGNGTLVALSGVGGALVGAGVGHIVAKSKEGYADQEDRLDAVIAQTTEENAKLREYVDALEALVQERRRETEALKAEKQKNALGKEKAAARLAAMTEDRKLVEKTLKKADERRAELVQIQSSIVGQTDAERERKAKFDAEIAEMNDLLSRGRALYDDLSPSRVG